MVQEHSPVPRARDDGAVFGGMERTDVVCVSEEGEVWLALGARQREDVDYRVLPSRDRVACDLQLSKGQGLTCARVAPQTIYSPSGAPGAGGRYATALMYLEPALRVDACTNAAPVALVHEIAVVSREAERMRSSVGDTTALT